MPENERTQSEEAVETHIVEGRFFKVEASSLEIAKHISEKIETFIGRYSKDYIQRLDQEFFEKIAKQQADYYRRAYLTGPDKWEHVSGTIKIDPIGKRASD